MQSLFLLFVVVVDVDVVVEIYFVLYFFDKKITTLWISEFLFLPDAPHILAHYVCYCRSIWIRRIK